MTMIERDYGRFLGEREEAQLALLMDAEAKQGVGEGAVEGAGGANPPRKVCVFRRKPLGKRSVPDGI